MYLIQSSQAFGVSQVIDDVLVNNLLASDFKRAYAVTWGATQSAVPGVVLTLKVGLNLVADSIVPNGNNRIPIFPDDQLTTFGVMPGDRIILSGRETTGVAKTLFYSFRFRPI
jgi:hypothetical protein